MTALSVKTLAPVKLNSTVLAVRKVSFPDNIRRDIVEHSGDEFARNVAVFGSDPRITFETPFFDAYTLCTLKGIALTTFEIYLATFASTGLKQTSTNHSKMGLNGGAAVATIKTLSVDQNGVCWATVEVVPTSSDGKTYPLLRTDSVAIPSLSTSPPAQHTLGPITLNGTGYSGVRSLNIDLGNVINSEKTDGDRFSQVAWYPGGKPTLSITHNDPMALIPVSSPPAPLGAGYSASTGNIVVWMKEINTATGLLKTTGASLTIATGHLAIDGIELMHQVIANGTLTILALSSDGATHPIVVSNAGSWPTP